MITKLPDDLREILYSIQCENVEYKERADMCLYELCLTFIHENDETKTLSSCFVYDLIKDII
jgi:hypothetical protein